MKILELRFRNLNSLYGEWLIDFTDPEYVSNGIFALTGPTGAGKSTVLDAICLALYGATPRLGKITKSENEIMTRHTGECYAEVLFESQAGRFRCHWQQRRARKKADGNLQDQEHQISDADSGKPIETRKSKVIGVVEEKTGMDFKRFTRSALLAQGGFDSFLNAEVEDKSKILEQITGTEIYSQISMYVHKRKRDKQTNLELLQAETSGIELLEPEQEKEINQDLVAKQKEETELSSKISGTEKSLGWLRLIDGLKKEIGEISEESAKLEDKLEAFKPERDRLDRAMRAASLAGAYATLTAIRQQQKGDQTSLNEAEIALPELESSAKKLVGSFKSMELQTSNAKAELKKEAPNIQKIRSLDQELTRQQQAISKDEKGCKKDAADIDESKQAKVEQQKTKAAAKKKLEIADGYLKKHAPDEWLISGLAGIEEQGKGLLSNQKEVADKEEDTKKAHATLVLAIEEHDKCSEHCSNRKQELMDAMESIKQGKATLSKLLAGRLLREYRTEKENLLREMVYLSKIAELEEHRAKLEDGQPCPLCGSEEHPFAEGNVPVPDEAEQEIKALGKLIAGADKLEAANKKLEEAEAAGRNNLADSEKLESSAANAKEAAKKTIENLRADLKKLRGHFSELKLALSDKLEPLGITEIPDDDVSSLLESLKERLEAWLELVKKKAKIDKQISGIDSEVTRLNAVIETQTKALDLEQKKLETLKKEHADKNEERIKLYGDKKPDDEENRLNKAIADAEKAEKKASSLNTERQQELTTAKTQVGSLKKSIDKRAPELAKAETDFSSALEPTGFPDEKQFLDGMLTSEQRGTLSTRAKELDEGQTALEARQKDRKTRLATEIAKKVTDKSLEELEPQFKKDKEFLSKLGNDIAEFILTLRKNISAKKQVKEKQSAINAQKKECDRWNKLHGLIGSADGKKYRNFAQGLTFELMVSHANRQLEKMTDRYQLIRDDKQPLELNVVDNYQAGEIRSTKNLSGGESFIVSLTLALGLSKMASRKVRVDSLFLDEGFGTLDEDALETALSTLSGLQQDGKLIGIISHVSALKERIGTQITVTPTSGGRSLLAGPGCAKLGH
ncbi:MAG: AAA family ATPase [Planctomycetes bacterium]|nr:AAA family ATPase [Planctomycetota bacterium]